MMKKKIAVPMFLKNGKAVTDFEGSSLNGNGDAKNLAQHYSNSGADELLIFDLSKGDAEHEQSLDLIREIGREIDIPMIGGGNIRRLEDVKKLIYAGCQGVFLNYAKESNVTLTEEASKRFGKDKIWVCADSLAKLEEEKERIFVWTSGVVFLLDKAENGKEDMEKAAAVLKMPVLMLCRKAEKAELLELLALEHVCGVCGSVCSDLSVSLMEMKQEAKSVGMDVRIFDSSMKWEEFKLNSDGMLPVVVQDYQTQEVLMVAYMNREAFYKTISTGKMTYWSRSRKELWTKGDTSGHVQYVKQLSIDCDNDTLLAKVQQIGAACHTGNRSCFYRDILKKDYQEKNPMKVFEEVYQVIEDRKKHPKEGSYTNYLFEKGIDKILKKVGEEAAEIIIAAKNPNPEEIKYEISDFLYHVMVLMSERGVTWEDITRELANR